MLSVGKLAAGPNAGRYYEDAVALGREDYYSSEGEWPGRWLGGGAEALGLGVEVRGGQTVRLMSGEDPTSRALLGRPMDDGSVAGFDLTFNAPKSIGLAFAIGDPWTARLLRECHTAAVDDALAYLERVACRARRGHGGAQVVEGHGFAAAAFDHRTSRAGDPLLHTHVVVVNRTLGPDGRWTALDARPVYRHAKTAGYLYQARLRHEVAERLGATWGPVNKGAADLHGFSRELIEHFSRRRAEILEQLELVGSHSLEAGNVAALETRRRKDHAVPIERLREEWRARAAEHGLTQQRVEELLTRRFRTRATAREVDLGELTADAATFTRRDVLQAVAEAHHDGAPTIAELEAKADDILSTREVVRIPDPAETRYTTETQLRFERNLLDSARARRDAHVAVAEPQATDRALADRSLSDEQTNAVRELTASGHGVEVLRAPAGAGKTFALDAAREAWQRSGHEVVGCALS
ncbi:MAG: putative ATP-dependent exoDNAse, partial [Frankiales bacterium]|nr:putative ATP-dependent exoDNAse [Frankiales bacterium]